MPRRPRPLAQQRSEAPLAPPHAAVVASSAKLVRSRTGGRRRLHKELAAPPLLWSSDAAAAPAPAAGSPVGLPVGSPSSPRSGSASERNTPGTSLSASASPRRFCSVLPFFRRGLATPLEASATAERLTPSRKRTRFASLRAACGAMASDGGGSTPSEAAPVAAQEAAALSTRPASRLPIQRSLQRRVSPLPSCRPLSEALK